MLNDKIDKEINEIKDKKTWVNLRLWIRNPNIEGWNWNR